VGDRERDSGTVSVRAHDEGDLGELDLKSFARRVTEES
jgi:threonyl-tRNA synthetase